MGARCLVGTESYLTGPVRTKLLASVPCRDSRIPRSFVLWKDDLSLPARYWGWVRDGVGEMVVSSVVVEHPYIYLANVTTQNVTLVLKLSIGGVSMARSKRDKAGKD